MRLREVRSSEGEGRSKHKLNAKSRNPHFQPVAVAILSHLDPARRIATRQPWRRRQPAPGAAPRASHRLPEAAATSRARPPRPSRPLPATADVDTRTARELVAWLPSKGLPVARPRRSASATAASRNSSTTCARASPSSRSRRTSPSRPWTSRTPRSSPGSRRAGASSWGWRCGCASSGTRRFGVGAVRGDAAVRGRGSPAPVDRRRAPDASSGLARAGGGGVASRVRGRRVRNHRGPDQIQPRRFPARRVRVPHQGRLRRRPRDGVSARGVAQRRQLLRHGSPRRSPPARGRATARGLPRRRRAVPRRAGPGWRRRRASSITTPPPSASRW